MKAATSKDTGVGSVIRSVLLAATAMLLLAATQTRADEVTWRSCDVDARHMSIWWWSTDEEADYLNLFHCQITTIQASSFKGIPNVKVISLNANRIEDIEDPNVFSNVPKLSILELDENKLPYMPALNIPNIEILSVDRNRISSLNDPNIFYSMKKVWSLSFELNEIQSVHPNIFQGLPKLQQVNFAENRLTYIGDKTFAVKSINSVNVGFNLIEYVSPGAFRGSSLEKLRIQGNKLNYLPENFVSELTRTGADLRGGWLFFSMNPFHCSCLLQLLAEVKKIDECAYNSVVYSGNYPVCTVVGADKCVRLSEVDYNNYRNKY